MIEHIKVEQKYSNSMILIFLHLENKFTIHWRFSSKLDAQCALNDSTFNVNQFFALLLLDNTSQIKKKMEVRRSTNNFVLCMLERVWPQLNWVWILKQNFKNFVPWKLKSAAPNELKTSRSMFYGRRDRKNQKRRFDWFYIILKRS